MVKVLVKWQGKKYEVEADLTLPGEDFKAQLFSLTGVAPDRQKILVKGGQLKDDTDMTTLGLKENQILMMVGSVGELPKAPTQPVKFVEDMSENEVAQALAIPAGLTNLGNTCYMNASLQCLKAIPELKSALDSHSAGQTDPRARIVDSMKNLFKQLNESGEGVPPFVFLQFLRQAYPRFAEQDSQHGGYRQQDAEEFWNEMLTMLDQVLGKDGAASTVVEKHMSGRMVTTWKCDEAPDEEPTVRHEPFRKLNCLIDKSVNYLSQGIKKSLEEVIEKRSETLDRNADYTSVSRIDRLPEYLTVTYNRFFWKASESIDAKIVKSVKFPLDLDVSEFCTPELTEKMRPVRKHLHALEEKKALERKLAKQGKNNSNSTETEAEKKDADVDMKTDEDGSSVPFVLNPELKADTGCNPSGVYELIGVVTHIGRTANSGHYMAWVRKEKGVGGKDPAGPGIPETQHWWYKFDDDDVSMVTDDEILKLCGGGDWHTAYVTLYRAKKLE